MHSVTHLCLLVVYKGVERGQKLSSKNRGIIHVCGLSMKMEDMHSFSFIKVYGLSSNEILYARSNQFLYVNKNL